MIVCNRCGKENQDHYKFCLGCGAELTAATGGQRPGGGDVAMMKTMMADPTGPTARPTGPVGPLGGMGPSGPLPAVPPPPGLGASGSLGSSGSLGHPPSSPPPLGAPGFLGGPPSGPLGAPSAPLAGSPTGPLGVPPLGAPPSAGPPAGPPPGVPAGYGPGIGGGAALGGSFGAPAPTPPVAAGPRRCPQCSNDVPANFRFCGACGFRMDEASGPAAAPPRATAPLAEQVRPKPKSTITLIRPDGSEGGVHELESGENPIGRTIGPLFENDGYLSPLHAELVINAAGAVVRDLDSLNGVFVKMTEEEEILPGQVIRIGQELLRFDLVQPPEPMPDGTEVMGSPNPGYWGKITVIIGRDVDGSAYPLLGEHVTLGRERGEINFPDDGYVSGLHARITMRDGRTFLADLGSSNGTFLKVNGERALHHESFVLLGQQLFRLDLAS
jgi:pSer/pThr/pTyr-binding forkhead associated (FHA) protein